MIASKMKLFRFSKQNHFKESYKNNGLNNDNLKNTNSSTTFSRTQCILLITTIV